MKLLKGFQRTLDAFYDSLLDIIQTQVGEEEGEVMRRRRSRKKEGEELEEGGGVKRN